MPSDRDGEPWIFRTRNSVAVAYHPCQCRTKRQSDPVIFRDLMGGTKRTHNTGLKEGKPHLVNPTAAGLAD
ncbi:hypothetical protein GCM10028805_37280 [Spirosoma harenae]